MKYNHLGEYDNYTLPDTLKEETPETRAKLKEALANIRAVAERNRREAEAANKPHS